ncbi:MobF family relaxase [Cellulomonas humilata]|uniref:Conjugative relaxase-like TrwC/TraI family protein n=1 Tax=Cellulomonas humilata TaxID=144055 RepID=A0ABU0EKX9_9CELL|nr:MobF family relaxase [Cellulomonas humilata]MDQ0375961.1 conjugative relaxase-like TrwC/TraI family protein [Cellulomonas humilata]
MSMCVRYGGDSYTYLVDSVAKDHGRAEPGSPMTRYYSAHGTPPGTWLGTGLQGLQGGHGLAVGSFATPVQMERIFGHGEDPTTAMALGRSPHVYGTEDARRTVAGFDCTFTVPKSVSVLWALGDSQTREAIYDCHRRAVDDVIALIERDAAKTRLGTDGVAQVDVRGVIAAAFDHWDSRENDPNLHTHVVLANRVQGPDGVWRTLDSRAIHKAAVALSERYDVLLADRVSATLGLDWEFRERGPGRNPAYELAAVPRSLTEAFSRRSAAIDAETDRLVDEWAAEHGRRPGPATILRLRQRATLTTRDAKTVHSLEELTETWRTRAAAILGVDAVAWATGVRANATPEPSPSAFDIAEVAEAVVAALTAKRATWTAWNIDAETSRAFKTYRFASADERDAATDAVVAEAIRRSVGLTPAPLAPSPPALQRADGATAFRAYRTERYTSQRLLDAEARLLAGGRDLSGPALSPSLVVPADLFDDQCAAVAAIATSGRVVDVLVGPAGSGKTRTLAALRAAWEGEHGQASVVGLAPSAAAADVLAQSLDLLCENTAKWLVEHDAEPDRLRRIERARAALHATTDPTTIRTLTKHLARLSDDVERFRFHPGQLVVLDEASLAGTLALDVIAACAGEAGAKLVLVGDWAQLSAIDAGGAFGLLTRDRGPDVPELGAARRFAEPWERDASTRLRVGDVSSLDDYAAHGRIQEGDHGDMVETAYTAWSADENAGQTSLLIAGDRDTVHTLNERAHTERLLAGRVAPVGTALHGGLHAGVGDRVVTRRNDRRLVVGTGWVKNGDIWTVTGRRDNGALKVRRAGGGPQVVLPADYVAAHVELGYATTAFRAQGATVDTAHALVTGPSMTREVLYVAMTRAREANRVYVCTDARPEPLAGFGEFRATGREVLRSVLSHVGAATSAHETRQNEADAAASIRTLAAEYESIAHAAEAQIWLAAFADAGLHIDAVREVESSPAFGALLTALRRTDALRLPIEAALPMLVTQLAAGSRDMGAVLHERVEQFAAHAAQAPAPGAFVAGLLPATQRAADAESAAALAARAQMIEERARLLVERAVAAGAPWLDDLVPPTSEPPRRDDWAERAKTVAAYRERYGISDQRSALGLEMPTDLQWAAARSIAEAALGEVRASVHRPVARGRGPQVVVALVNERQTPAGR